MPGGGGAKNFLQLCLQHFQSQHAGDENWIKILMLVVLAREKKKEFNTSSQVLVDLCRQMGHYQTGEFIKLFDCSGFVGIFHTPVPLL